MSFNKIIIIGNLGKDPDLRYTPQGVAVANFSIATNERRKDKSGESQDITTWFKVTVWRIMAENAAKYLTKGSPVYIEGRLSIEEWTDRDGANRYTLEVQATDMQFISSGNRSETNGSDRRDTRAELPTYSGPGPAAEPAPAPTPFVSAIQDDDIPF